MNGETFKQLLDELDGNSLQTLKEKNARYSQNGDCLHNFRKGAAFNQNTLGQTCWGYMSKHLVALQDMVERNDFSNREDFLEKCQDTINYIRFLWCIGNDKESLIKTTIKDPVISQRTLVCRRLDNSVFKEYFMTDAEALDMTNEGFMIIGHNCDSMLYTWDIYYCVYEYAKDGEIYSTRYDNPEGAVTTND